MTITTLTSRAFNQDAGCAKRLANAGPVFITDRGRTAHVLLSVEDYQRLQGQGSNIVELLAAVTERDVDFEPPRLSPFTRVPDLS